MTRWSDTPVRARELWFLATGLAWGLDIGGFTGAAFGTGAFVVVSIVAFAITAACWVRGI